MATRGSGLAGSWRQILLYGAVLAAGTAALDWLDYRHLARTHSGELQLAIVAAAFLALGIVVGLRVFAAPAPPRGGGNPAAVAQLGITARELAVLRALADGGSNQDIAHALGVSPNTVKTHVAGVYRKLGARRRTDAIARARDLGVLD